jgi:HEPN domain-containing protein
LTDQQKQAIALFNYAHSYAQSAVTLEANQTEATHWDAPVLFLYFHAIELYLKAFLVALGHDLDVLKKKHGHKVKPLAVMCQHQGVQLSLDAQEVIYLMTETDNVISSRYIRLGNHRQLPFSVYFEMCQSLHEQIGFKVYEGSGVTRMPVLSRNR